MGSGRAQQVVPFADARVEDSFAEGFEPIDVLDGLDGGDRRGVGLTEALGPLTKQKLLASKIADTEPRISASGEHGQALQIERDPSGKFLILSLATDQRTYTHLDRLRGTGTPAKCR